MPTDQNFCHVHIGAPKTGSTFLERVFYENRDELRRRGLLYPDVNIRGFGHHDIAFLLSGGYPEWATGQDRPLSAIAADLETSIAGHDGSILLSSEIFYLFPAPAALKALLEKTGALPGRRPRIVVYIRPQDEAHESWYNQRVKAQGETGPIEDSIKQFDGLWDYERQLRLWADVFGDDALVVKRYGRSAKQESSLLDDILKVLGLRDFVPRLPRQSVNVRENRDILSFQRELNRLPLSAQEKRRFHRELMVLSERAKGRGVFDERPLLDRSDREAIMARYASGNAAVARQHFAGEPLFPAMRKSDQGGQNSCAPCVEAGLTDKKLVYILGWLVEYRYEV